MVSRALAAVSISLIYFAVACGSAGDPKPSITHDPAAPANHAAPETTTEPHVVKRGSIQEARQVVEESQVHCKDKGSCHDSVAFLTTAAGKKAVMCTASLIGPRLLMTNSHCIPPEMKQGTLSCADSTVAHFPETATYPAVKIRCGKLISYSEYQGPDGSFQMDYAFIELAQDAGRPVLAIDRSGFQEHEEVIIARVTPVDGTGLPQGSLDPIRCKVVMKTTAQPQFDNPTAPLVTLGDCPGVRGNSGSPVLDLRGRVKGVAQSVVNGSNLPREMLADGVPQMMTATNLACVPADGYQPPPSCSIELSSAANTRKLALIEREAFKEHMAEVNRKFLAWHQQAFRNFVWATRFEMDAAKPGLGWMTPMPFCLPRQPEWISRSDGTLRMELPQYSRRMMYSRYLNILAVQHPDRAVQAALSFDPKEVARSGELSIREAVTQPDRTFEFSTRVKYCN